MSKPTFSSHLPSEGVEWDLIPDMANGHNEASSLCRVSKGREGTVATQSHSKSGFEVETESTWIVFMRPVVTSKHRPCLCIGTFCI